MILPLFLASHSRVRHATPLFPIDEPAPLELHWTDIGQRRMHRGAHGVGGEGSLALVAAVLASAVGVEDQPRHRMPSELCHSQCVDHEILLRQRQSVNFLPVGASLV